MPQQPWPLDCTTTGMKTRIFIVGDIRFYREGLARCLAQTYDVVGTASDNREALQDLSELQPDLVLVDMASLESLSTVRALVEFAEEVKVVAVAVPETAGHVLACAEAGISGYVSREASLGDLVGTIESVATGETVCSPRIVASLFRRVASLAAERAPDSPRATLTAREAEILDLIDQGLSNKEIAGRLFIEVATVKNHVHNILEKLHVHRRAEAAATVRHEHHGPTRRSHSQPDYPLTNP
jgi:two-component system, NarL family, nitrate/nitrite response regulator NarL